MTNGINFLHVQYALRHCHKRFNRSIQGPCVSHPIPPQQSISSLLSSSSLLLASLAQDAAPMAAATGVRAVPPTATAGSGVHAITTHRLPRRNGHGLPTNRFPATPINRFPTVSTHRLLAESNTTSTTTAFWNWRRELIIPEPTPCILISSRGIKPPNDGISRRWSFWVDASTNGVWGRDDD